MILRRKYPLLLVIVTTLFFVSSCSKSSSGDDTPPPAPPAPVEPEPDYSQCLLDSVNYPYGDGAPYRDPITLTYDSLKRVVEKKDRSSIDVYTYETSKIIQTTYDDSSMALIKMLDRKVYTLDNNGRVVSNTWAFYNRPSSINDYTRQDRLDYEYDTDGYLTGEKWYAYGWKLMRASKFTYNDGNLVLREITWYDIGVSSSVKKGVDTINYTYDNTSYFPEAAYLYEVVENMTGKPNKNNVTGIQVKLHDEATAVGDYYKSIQYAYTIKGKRLEKVKMTAATAKGVNVNNSIGFTYQCD